jgi:putative IMPACT (imprinted ancient) family translation regulator
MVGRINFSQKGIGCCQESGFAFIANTDEIKSLVEEFARKAYLFCPTVSFAVTGMAARLEELVKAILKARKPILQAVEKKRCVAIAVVRGKGGIVLNEKVFLRAYIAHFFLLVLRAK